VQIIGIKAKKIPFNNGRTVILKESIILKGGELETILICLKNAHKIKIEKTFKRQANTNKTIIIK
jgi:hypothetical protein